MLFGLLVFGAIVVVVFSFVATYNRLVANAERATSAWNELDALLRQQHDEIPRGVEMCEPHFGRDRAVLDRLLDARAAVFLARQNRDADELGRAEAGLRAAATAVIARANAQPELLASPAYGLIRQRAATLDSELHAARQRYNQAVGAYNASISRVPGRVVALIGEFAPLHPLDFESAGS